MTSLMHIIWTLALLILFVGIVLWAWSGRRKKDFEEASQLPLDADALQSTAPRGKYNG